MTTREKLKLSKLGGKLIKIKLLGAKSPIGNKFGGKSRNIFCVVVKKYFVLSSAWACTRHYHPLITQPLSTRESPWPADKSEPASKHTKQSPDVVAEPDTRAGTAEERGSGWFPRADFGRQINSPLPGRLYLNCKQFID